MKVTKFYCDKCRKELELPPPYNSSKVDLEGEQIVEAVEERGGLVPHETDLFEGLPHSFYLCHDCGSQFKEYLKAFFRS